MHMEMRVTQHVGDLMRKTGSASNFACVAVLKYSKLASLLLFAMSERLTA